MFSFSLISFSGLSSSHRDLASQVSRSKTRTKTNPAKTSELNPKLQIFEGLFLMIQGPFLMNFLSNGTPDVVLRLDASWEAASRRAVVVSFADACRTPQCMGPGLFRIQYMRHQLSVPFRDWNRCTYSGRELPLSKQSKSKCICIYVAYA